MSQSHKRNRRLAITASLALTIAFLPSGSLYSQEPLVITMPKPGERIQLDMWTDVKLGIKDPLTQVVHVTRTAGGGGGSGFLLANCRVLTAVHVIAGSLSGTRSDMDSADRDQFVGERFNYESQPVPWLQGRRVTGSFVVIAHGRMTEDQRPNAAEREDGDWAVGYDEDCTGDKNNLGTVDLFSTSSLDGKGLNMASAMARQIAASKLEGRRFLMAGYPSITIPGQKFAKPPLYIDSDCGISAASGDHDGDVYDFFAHSVIQLTCSGYYGASGAPVLQVVMKDGAVDRDAAGRPHLEAVGIVVRRGRYDEPLAPFSKKVMEAVAMTSTLRARLRPYLTVKMNPQILDALHKLVDERAHEMSVDDAILKRFASLPKGSVLPGPPGTPVSECSKRPVTDPIAQAKVCTDILARPDITQMAVLQIMRMRGAARRQGGQFGQSLRDLDKTLRLAQKLTGIESTMMQLHAEFGDTYHYLHQPYSAVRHYDDALNYLYGLGTTDPKIKLDLVRKRAFVYDESHQFSLAVGDYNLLLASIPADAELWNGRCYAAASDLGANAAALTRALDDCNKALSLKPGAAHIFDSRAFVHMRAGRWEAAITDYTAALAADPKMTSALYGRATAREQTGDTAGRTQDLAAYREQDDWYTTYLELKSRGLFSATKR